MITKKSEELGIAALFASLTGHQDLADKLKEKAKRQVVVVIPEKCKAFDWDTIKSKN